MAELVRRRMRSKTTPPHRRPQNPLPDILELGDEGTAEDKKKVYLVTLPHPKQDRSADGFPLVAPGSLSKQDILERFRDSCAHPIYADQVSMANSCAVKLEMCGIWREFHKPGEAAQADTHDHLPMKAEASFRFMPVKRALLRRHGLASHWSCTHVGYWSCVRYCAVPSPKKPFASLDHKPLLWPEATHPKIEECCHQPVTANALHQLRQKRVLDAAELGEEEPRVTEMDVWALVVRTGIRNTDDSRRAHLELAAYAKQHCSTVMCAYLFKNRAKLPGLIDDIWQWENAEQLLGVAQRTRMQAMEAAAQSTCVCNGEWISFVVSCFVQNSVDLSEVCHDIMVALRDGRSETTPVIVLAGASGGEGKSAFLKGLLSVFDAPGLVFQSPGKGNFPLLDLPQAAVAFLDEFRFDPDIVPFSVQQLWFDGSGVPIARPQNTGAAGHLLYKGSAPVFVTTKLADLRRLERAAAIDRASGLPADAEASMLLRRLKTFSFTKRVVKPAKKFAYCGHCFARLVQAQAGAWSARQAQPEQHTQP